MLNIIIKEEVLAGRMETKRFAKILLNIYRSQWKTPYRKHWAAQQRDYDRMREAMAHFRKLKSKT